MSLVHDGLERDTVSASGSTAPAKMDGRGTGLTDGLTSGPSTYTVMGPR